MSRKLIMILGNINVYLKIFLHIILIITNYYKYRLFCQTGFLNDNITHIKKGIKRIPKLHKYSKNLMSTR